MSVGAVTLPNRVFLAPLSGISDVPFRRLARRFGAGMVVSEMVASAELVQGHPESALRALRDGEGTHVVQLAGRDPAWTRAAAAQLADAGADVIDINMGCPAKKVVGGLSGSALMREPELALRIVEATVAGAAHVPVTLKMRLGWDTNSINAPEIAKRAEAAGVRMITVHGRTRVQFYSGQADWRAIAAVKAAVGVPVVANGDLTEPEQRRRMLFLSGADALMIGRGAQGRPWLPGLVAGSIDLAGLDRLSFADLVTEHYDGILDHYGEVVGIRAARKHLGWYLDRFAEATGATPAADRPMLMSSLDRRQVQRTLRHLFGGTTIGAIERGRRVASVEAA
ncbi:tRNA dihydrouridine synthase DusB [Aureimonas leprariae]|uniref:tRNA dihydrouridine synthase DusB n=1 Tax=Plantimonas leprariae TaxID=2615207 RepID=UPI003CCD6097